MLLFELFLPAPVSAYQDIDHATILQSLNQTTLQKGKQIYMKSCIACHGADGTASLPQARSFNKDVLRFGTRPYDMWKTITNGSGMMASQTWLKPEERYYVIQFIREEFMKKGNPGQYFKLTKAYLASLPKLQKTSGQQLTVIKKQALTGSLEYGQQWFVTRKSDYGQAIYSPLKGLGTSVVTIKLDGQVYISYNLHRMGTLAAWKGKLNVSETKFNRYRGEGEPFVEGIKLPGLDKWEWTYNGTLDSLNKTTGVRAPLPEKFLKYNGHFVYGKEVILSYDVSGRNILEHPESKISNGKPILSQTLKISPGQKEQLCIGQLKDSLAHYQEGVMSFQGKFLKGNSDMHGNLLVSLAQNRNGNKTYIAAGIITSAPGISWFVDENHRLLVTIPESKDTIDLRILRFSGSSLNEVVQFGSFVKAQSVNNVENLTAMTNGSTAIGAKKVLTKGEINASRPHFDPKYYKDKDKTAPEKLVAIPEDYPYAVDNIGLPFDNPYNAWIRPTAVDFMSDGRLIMTTYMGDVWMATGIDEKLENISWQRIATGLYEPMGIKVVRDEIFVICRNGIIRLNDLNKDSETDFYELFYADQDVSAFFHAFNFGLATDSKGNFYYTKPGEYTDNKDPGNLIRVSPDGKKWESLATGFRVNNGITITPDDRIFVSDNQGNWTPSNKINLVETGKFYGYVPNLVEKEWSPNGVKFREKDVVKGVINHALVKVPDRFSPPALWMPQEFDNSPGGGMWSDKSWGPLGNQFIHTSYGTGWLYNFFAHETAGITQGAMVALPFQMDAGIQRAAVNPVDRQIYTTGLTGWDDGVSTQYGVLSRIRYKGGQGHLLTDAFVEKGGVTLKFNFKLDAETVRNISGYELNQWNYKWTSRYGSAHYSVKNPEIEAEDSLTLTEVILRDDNKTIFLNIPDISEANTLRVRFKVNGEDGVKINDTVYMTIQKVPGMQQE
ncbi:DUF6797 domain-containing protein [Dyadobacter sp. NIV53]|uniref:DUF6797 domain-containing protein n=1 Tax=Dyadobacter sp. NIV53 TaxID=2861765 RepID=UPI001C86F987|nr:DUF6797 domain-containing protein [Dyadobacter sp. NIV53]